MNTRFGVKIDPSRLHLVSRERLEAFFIANVRPVPPGGDFALCQVRGEIFDVLCDNRRAPTPAPVRGWDQRGWTPEDEGRG